MQNPNSGTLTSGVLASAFVIILAWVLSLQGVTVPADIQVAMTTLVAYATSFFVHAKPDADPSSSSKGFGRLPLIVLVTVVGLVMIAGCGTKPGTISAKTPNQIAADAFGAACMGVPVADLAFAAVGVFNPTIIDANARRWEASFYAGLVKRCAGPAPTVETYQQVVNEIAVDVKQIMDVVAAAKNNPTAP